MSGFQCFGIIMALILTSEICMCIAWCADEIVAAINRIDNQISEMREEDK